MKIYFDLGCRDCILKVGDLVYLKIAKGIEKGYRLLDNLTKLSFVKMGPYPVKKVINPISFQIDLPDWFNIYDVISIDHLESTVDDPFHRAPPESGSIIQDGE